MKGYNLIIQLLISILFISIIQNDATAQEKLKDKAFLIGNGLKKATNLDWSNKKNEKKQALYIHNKI